MSIPKQLISILSLGTHYSLVGADSVWEYVHVQLLEESSNLNMATYSHPRGLGRQSLLGLPYKLIQPVFTT